MASEKWNDPNHRAETLVIVTPPGGTATTYGMDKIKSLTTNTSLFGDYYDIGKCVTNSIHAEFYDVTAQEIPKMSRVEVVLRIYGEGDTEETAQLVARGVYYTKRPYYDTESGILEIEGYDEMYKAETIPYPLGSTVTGWNSETLRTVTQRMANVMNVSVASTTLPLIGTDNFALPPFGYTAREVLSDIARAMGGNFVMTSVIVGTPTNPRVNSALKFVPLDQVSGTPTDLGREPQTFSEGDDIEQVGYVIVNYGYDDEGATLSKFSGTEGSGRTVEYTISTITDGSEIQDFADRILAVYQNVSVYEPYSASGCELDPTVQVGDMVSCNGRTAMLGSLTTHFSVAMYSDIESPSIPEEDDFPCYSQDREIQRNYETEASKIAGTVKFVDLSTAGATEINGSNIKSGTITLGGQDNGNGQMVILDENDAEIGRWNNDRLIVRDDSVQGYEDKAKMAVIRQGDADDTEFGTFIGATTQGASNQGLKPFVFMRDTYNGTDTYGENEVSAWRIKMHNEDTNADVIIDGHAAMITLQKENPVTQAVQTAQIGNTPIQHAPMVTRTSGLTINTQTFHTWGRVAQLTLFLNATNGTTVSPGNVFEGQLSDFLPINNIMSASYYGTTIFGCSLRADGVLTVRSSATQYFDGGNLVISFVYLF